MIDYLASSTLLWPLAILSICTFEVQRWRTVPNVIRPHGEVPVFVALALAVNFLVSIFSLVSIWVADGFLNAMLVFIASWLIGFVVGGIVIPIVFKGDHWVPFTLGCLAVLPAAYICVVRSLALAW